MGEQGSFVSEYLGGVVIGGDAEGPARSKVTRKFRKKEGGGIIAIGGVRRFGWADINSEKGLPRRPLGRRTTVSRRQSNKRAG